MSNAEVKPPNNITVFSNFMDRMKPQLALALPKHLTADRMARLAMTAFSTSQQLQNCDPKSIAASIMVAGQLGLEPGVNGQGYLIPYGRICTFVPGWKGLVDLVSRSGRGTVYTGVIFNDQRYEFRDGAKRDLTILNETELDAPEDITHAYAIGWVKDAAMPIIELWTVGKIRKHRDKYNKVGQKHYSFRDWEMYCRKVPLLQVLKYMPCSVEMSNAISISHSSEAGRGATIENGIVIDLVDGRETRNETEINPRQTYSAEEFAKDFPGWKKMIESGKKTAEQAIATMRSKAPLTEAQEAAIMDCTPASAVTFAQVSEALNTAGDADTLDVKADLIRQVSDEKQRDELTNIYRELRAQMAG